MSRTIPSRIGGVELLPKFLIEREIAGARQLSAKQIKGISQISCGVFRRWARASSGCKAYVTDDKIYCIYIAPDEATVREHPKQGGLSANKVAPIHNMIDPAPAE